MIVWATYILIASLRAPVPEMNAAAEAHVMREIVRQVASETVPAPDTLSCHTVARDFWFADLRCAVDAGLGCDAWPTFFVLHIRSSGFQDTDVSTGIRALETMHCPDLLEGWE